MYQGEKDALIKLFGFPSEVMQNSSVLTQILVKYAQHGKNTVIIINLSNILTKTTEKKKKNSALATDAIENNEPQFNHCS